MPPVRQSSFAGGEFAPGLWGRTNLRDFANALRLSRNMIPRQEGPLSNRAGTLHQGLAKTSTGKCRIHPFVFSQGSLAQTYVLEIGAGYIHIWKNGVKVVDGGGVPIEIVTPYTDEDVPRLKFTQQGQVLTIACKQKVTREITWSGDANWVIVEFTTVRTLQPPASITTPTANPGDESNTARLWEWVVTSVDPTDKYESLPTDKVSAITQINANHPITLTFASVAGVMDYNVYRGRNGKFGFIGTATISPFNPPGTVTFYDDGQYPVYASVPPTGRNPFWLLGNVGSPERFDNQPQVVTYHDQRLVFANAWNAPGEVEMSRIGEYHNFDRAAPPRMEDAVTFNVVGRRYEEIRSMVSVRLGMMIFTNATEWMVTGSAGIIAQDDIALSLKSHWGSSWLDPLVIGEEVLFNLDTGSSVRSMIPALEDPGKDLTLLAQHLFQGRTITGWTYAHEPFRVIWATRDDGELLSCTYVKEHDVLAWARHDTDGDFFEDVCSVPEAGEDVVYFLIKRQVNGSTVRYFERMAPRVGITRTTGVFLDSAVTRENVTTVTGLTHLEGRVVYALADGIPRGPFTVSGGQITLPAQAAKAHVGLRILAQGATLDIFSTQEEVRPNRKLVKKVYAEVMESAPFRAGQRLDGPLRKARRPDGQAWDLDADLYTGLAEISIESTWSDAGAVVWQQEEPLPLTLLSVIREVEFGGN